MAAAITAGRVSELIGLIYDCALDPTRWPVALAAINLTCDFASAALGLRALPSGRDLLNVTACSEPFWQSRVEAYGEDIIALWGGPRRIGQYPLDEPIVRSKVEDLPALQDYRVYAEWMQPQGFTDVVVIAFARDTTMIGNVAFSRHSAAGDVGDRELIPMGLLAPHFRRAAAISKLLDLKTIEARTFEHALNSFSVGIVLVDERLGIVHANAAAEAMLSAADSIRSHNGKLVASSNTATSALQASVAQAAAEEQRLGRRGIGVPLRRRDGSHCVVHVLPMGGGEIRPAFQRGARAALFIASATTPPQMPRDALAAIYDMTNAESRVFELVAEGKTQAEIALELDLAASTVKTHLLHVFTKTGCRRQVDLVKLAASLSMPL